MIQIDPKEIKDDVAKFAQGVNADFNKEINPLLSKWARSKWAGALAVGFGVALLAIGAVVVNPLFKQLVA